MVSLPTFPPHEAQLPYRLQPNTEWQQSRSHRAGKAAHRLGKEKPSALHKPAALPWFPCGQHGPLWELGTEPVLQETTFSISELSCPFLLLQQLPRSTYIQMAPTCLPPHSHVCWAVFILSDSATPWTTAHQAYPSLTISQSLLRLVSINR